MHESEVARLRENADEKENEVRKIKELADRVLREGLRLMHGGSAKEPDRERLAAVREQVSARRAIALRERDEAELAYLEAEAELLHG